MAGPVVTFSTIVGFFSSSSFFLSKLITFGFLNNKIAQLIYEIKPKHPVTIAEINIAKLEDVQLVTLLNTSIIVCPINPKRIAEHKTRATHTPKRIKDVLLLLYSDELFFSFSIAIIVSTLN